MATRRFVLGALVGIAVAWAVPVGAAVAGKPPGGGGGGDEDVDTGLIYFTYQQRMWSMNPDGSGKTMLPAGVTPGVQWAIPSRTLHGGHRWFVTLMPIAGETYPSGNQRHEFVATRDDGAVVVQLTDEPDLQGLSPRWSPGDLTLSWSAMRWVGGVSGAEGIYMSDVTFAGGDIAGLASQPASPAVVFSEASGGASFNHDWAPDATKLSIGRYYSGALSVATLATGLVTPLTTSAPAYGPVWSPDGSRIAFECPPANRYAARNRERTASIRTIAPDGSGETSFVSEVPKTGTFVDFRWQTWSPNGTNLAYVKSTTTTGYDGIRNDIHRIPAGGGTPTNLTADLDTANQGVRIWGWR